MSFVMQHPDFDRVLGEQRERRIHSIQFKRQTNFSTLSSTAYCYNETTVAVSMKTSVNK